MFCKIWQEGSSSIDFEKTLINTPLFSDHFVELQITSVLFKIDLFYFTKGSRKQRKAIHKQRPTTRGMFFISVMKSRPNWMWKLRHEMLNGICGGFQNAQVYTVEQLRCVLPCCDVHTHYCLWHISPLQLKNEGKPILFLRRRRSVFTL